MARMPAMLRTKNVMRPRPAVVARLPVTAPPSQTASPPRWPARGEGGDHAQQVRVEDEKEEGEAEEVESLSFRAEHRLEHRVAHVLEEDLEKALQARGLLEGVAQLARQVEHGGEHQQADDGHEDEVLGDVEGQVETADAERWWIVAIGSSKLSVSSAKSAVERLNSSFARRWALAAKSRPEERRKTPG